MRRAFTLVEVIAIVVLLGIVAAIAMPRMSSAQQDADLGWTLSELERVRRAVAVYRAMNEGELPTIVAGDSTWGQLSGEADYLMNAPENRWVGSKGARVVLRSSPDVAYQSEYGWIYDEQTGEVWAGGFDLNDEPFPR
ncbi:MAG: type II secretion system protein [Planctomycetota bacterium]